MLHTHALTPTITWEDALNLFALRCQALNLSPKTLTVYNNWIKHFIRWADKYSSPQLVTPSAIREYIASFVLKKRSCFTVLSAHSIVSIFFRTLADEFKIDNPAVGIQKPRIERKDGKTFNADCLGKFLSKIDTSSEVGARNFALFILMADTGLRISECVGIKFSDINWEEKTIIIIGKGSRQRRVAFGETAAMVLRKWVDSRKDNIGSIWGKLTACTVRMHLRTYSTAAGFAEKGLSCHAFRRFFALSFLKNHGNVRALQKLLGHSTIEMSMRYVNLIEEEIVEEHRAAGPIDHLRNKLHIG